ncbi:uncharacterized protein PpBr36_10609 [Pyricularia pennisetigena]|uniref:uncharacterized protein n=1 Tax=Pyricularia pennisetigena TaxID=1578925 RepID=UPI00114E24DA|nr:uncharacterized protein PpBr36_10609 [Pyricularia pennisetigena]TLS21100.1 hypothetical protein PpBr36_10609 [Pyricularia pennisetigena]
MDQQYSTSKVTVEYFDPHDVYKLIAPGLLPLLPLRNLNWKSHAGPPRSINTLHVDLVPAGGTASGTTATATLSPVASPQPKHAFEPSAHDNHDGFQTQTPGSLPASGDHADPLATAPPPPGRERRHQIPGLRRTPYLKILLVRCDDNDSYKAQTRSEIRDWLKQNTPPQSSKKASKAENHDAFEWLIVHVVIPNTVAATQPRITGKSDVADAKVASRWRGSSTTLLEKLMTDFNTTKGPVDRVAQIRIGINDVPYDILPRVVPAVPTGYTETSQDVENAWADLIGKMKAWILSSFDMRVSQYEEDIKEKDAQRNLPGWNFCTFFILKEGLARGFESVGLVEDALVGYDELSVGLDAIIHGQAGTQVAETHGGSLLPYTEELKIMAQRALAAASNESMDPDDDNELPVDLQAGNPNTKASQGVGAAGTNAMPDSFDHDVLISANKKPYRELILANNVSVFDFRCYIFARQIALLFRLGNATATREELLAKTREQQEYLLHGVAPRTPALVDNRQHNDAENLSMLAEVCRRTLEFIPSVSTVMRQDLLAALGGMNKTGEESSSSDKTYPSPRLVEVVDNIVSSFAFSAAQQILAQTSTKALPIPEPSVADHDSKELKAKIPEPKTMVNPVRSSSLHGAFGAHAQQGAGIAQVTHEAGHVHTQFLKAGLEELAARRAELFTLSRNILEECGKKWGWSDGWDSVPLVGDPEIDGMEDINLDDEGSNTSIKQTPTPPVQASPSLFGLGTRLLWTALDSKDDFYRLYETLTLKALRHYVVASHFNSVKANMIDMAVLKFHLGEFHEAAKYFMDTIPFFGERGWSLLELSLLVMYCKCLEELGHQEDYVKVTLKLLSKAAMAEHERLQHRRTGKAIHKAKPTRYPESTAIRGFLPSVLQITKELTHDVLVPLRDFFSEVTFDGAPAYNDMQDSFSICLAMQSLLVDDLELDQVQVKLRCNDTSGLKYISLANPSPVCIKPGRNKVELTCNVAVAGEYEIEQILLRSGKLQFHLERDPAFKTHKGIRGTAHPEVVISSKLSIFQRAGSLDIRLLPAKQIRLDKNSSLEIELTTGWNRTRTCDVRVKAATGGLRLLVSDGTLVNGKKETRLEPPEAGLFHLGELEKCSTVRLRFPYTVEQDVPAIAVRVEVMYTTKEDGPVHLFAKTPSISISLALGVNVQDVFKHNALFSRFTVTTASASPLRLFASELLESDLFSADLGGTPPPSRNDTYPITVFPEQPASLLYKMVRKRGSTATGKGTSKTMYLKLTYTVVQDEIESLVEASLMRAFESDEALGKLLSIYSRLVTGIVLAHIRTAPLASCDLEQTVMSGFVSTAFLANVPWETRLTAQIGLANGCQIASKLASVIRDWQVQHPRLVLTSSADQTQDLSCILIPVDIPSISIVHTADIQLVPNSSNATSDGGRTHRMPQETWKVNELIPSNLHLKWSRIWDTGDAEKEATSPPSRDAIEFSYEVTAPQDTWLIGGRRKGHFVIPGLDEDATTDEKLAYSLGACSTPDTEADIALLLVPLREGWLPFPSVEIREVRSFATGTTASREGDVQTAGTTVERGTTFETDFKNLGEAIHVIADRHSVTLSLDASGPGGGPLVLGNI